MPVHVCNNEGLGAKHGLAGTAQAHERSTLLYPYNSGIIHFATLTLVKVRGGLWQVLMKW